MLSDEKFYERAQKFALYKTTEGKYYTMDELTEQIKTTQTDKDDKLVYLYTSDKDAQYSYIEAAKNKGYEVLVMDTPLTSHLVGKFEQTLENSTFARVDADTIDKLINKDEEIPSKLSDDEKEQLKPVIEEVVNKEKFNVQFESMNETDQPMTIVQPEFMRRMKDMQAVGGGGMAMFGGMPETYNLIVNVNHPLIGKIMGENCLLYTSPSPRDA